jgi:UDP-N-acetylglucosamine 1-carboxyvinyltransferase
MAEIFEIEGGKKLKGVLETRGSKNAAFPVLAATLLTKEDCVIDNLPLIEDVFRMLEILKSLGVKIDWLSERKIKVNAQKLSFAKVDKKIISLLRGSILLYGALLRRMGEVFLPRPGGCIIGARPIDSHLNAFSQFGVEVEEIRGDVRLKFSGKKIKPHYEIVLDEFSVTGTANILLFAATLPSETTIKIADEDYQVQELLKVLAKMGVKIIKIGHHEIQIQGKGNLKGFSHQLLFDPLEAGTFIIMGAATKSELTVKNVEVDFLELFFKKLKDAGLPLLINEKQKEVKVFPFKSLKFGKLQALPYPGLHSDLLSALAVLATQAEGTTLIQDPLYEGRFKYLEEINQMGAKIFFADPHRVLIEGPTPLFGKSLGSLDIRGGAALLIAALIAQGKSKISNIYQIDRGYERIEERLQKIGAQIKRVVV